jgi:nucleoside-diphosphate-sugar epimerase
MKYFITGATGFVGGRIAAMLRENDHKVNALVRSPAKAGDLEKLGVEVFPGDVTEIESMREGMRGCDGIFHVAGWYKLGARDKSPGRRINVDGTRNVLKLMRELEIPKGVYTSTLAVNSNTKGQVYDETYRFSGRHISEYDRTKAEAHDIALEYIKDGLPLVILMPGLIYGPDGTSLSDHSFRLYLQKKLPVIPRISGYCWAHVDDIARAHLDAMEKAAGGTSYIIGGPRHTLVEAFEIAEKTTGIPAPSVIAPALLKLMAFFSSLISWAVSLPELYAPETLRVQAGVTYYADNAKAKRELGYSPRPLEEGLRETLLYEMEKLKTDRG